MKPPFSNLDLKNNSVYGGNWTYFLSQHILLNNNSIHEIKGESQVGQSVVSWSSEVCKSDRRVSTCRSLKSSCSLIDWTVLSVMLELKYHIHSASGSAALASV
jgi:hypothetical protein